MKKLFTLFFIFNLSQSFAGPGNGAGHIERALKVHDVIAITTKDGDYARLEDLKEEFIKFNGVEVVKDKIIFDLEHPQFNIETVITK